MVAIFGLFMLNPEGEVCFAQIGEHHVLHGVRIVSGGSAIAVLPDGSEEMFTSEIEPLIISALRKQTELLVAHVGEDGKCLREYNVALNVES